MRKSVKKLLDELTHELETTPLQEVEFGDAPKGATYLRGLLPSGWRVLVVEFDIEDQGFPPGSKGYDGTAVKSSMLCIETVMRLTRELAELAFKKAREHERATSSYRHQV